jgi:hypothetical protein
MIRCLFALFFLLTSIVLNSSAFGVTIVDTGPGPDAFGGYDLSRDQWFAGKFSTSEQFIITDVKGWMASTWYGDGTATAVIYSDGGTIPGTELFSARFTVPGNYESISTSDLWYGPSGLNWPLGSGTYWVAFEVRGGDGLDGYMPFPVSSFIEVAVYSYNRGPGYQQSSHPIEVGFRISARREAYINPAEGTIGTDFTITGSDFGDKKGNVFLGNVPVTIRKWTDELISCHLRKPLSPGTYVVTIVPREPEESPPITLDKVFVVNSPEIGSITEGYASAGERITILGSHFGSHKGKVYLGYTSNKGKYKKKRCPVINWRDNEILFVVPDLAAGSYDVIVTNRVDSSRLVRGFEVYQ